MCSSRRKIVNGLVFVLFNANVLTSYRFFCTFIPPFRHLVAVAPVYASIVTNSLVPEL